MTTRGFTLVELLLALVLTLIVLAGVVTLAGWARWSFSIEPAALDTTRRARQGVLLVADAVAGTAGGGGDGRGLGALAASVPVVWPQVESDSPPPRRFTAVWVLRVVPGAAGRLGADQIGSGDALTLDLEAECPRSTAVCGFDAGDQTVVFDSRGHFDVFEVGSVSETLGRLSPDTPLTHTYRAGDRVLAARAERYDLARQPDGSRSLVRRTWAGATEPIADGVVDIQFVPWGRPDVPVLVDAGEGAGLASYALPPPAADSVDVDGVFGGGEHCLAARDGGGLRSTLTPREADDDGLVRLEPADFEDGPWCPNAGAAALFDGDLLRLQRVDLRMRVEVLSARFRGPVGALFTRGGTADRDARQWIRDLEIAVSVGLTGR